MTTHRNKILLSGWIATALIVLLELLTPTEDTLGFSNNALTSGSLTQAVLFSGLTMAGLHAYQHPHGIRRAPVFVGACVWFGARLLGLLLSLVVSSSITIWFFLLAGVGAIIAFLIGTIAGSVPGRSVTGGQMVTTTHDLRSSRTLWVALVFGTGLILLALYLTSYVLDGSNIDATLFVRNVVSQLGVPVVLSVMLLAIPLHIRLMQPVVLIPLALFVLFETLPTFTGVIGLSLNIAASPPLWLFNGTSWLGNIAWIVAVVAMIVVYSRADERLRRQQAPVAHAPQAR